METAQMQQISINKSDWKRVKFGDVVFEPKETVKSLLEEDIEHVVGLEHIDSENIHLTRSGNLEASTTFSKKFKKGDVLFGRRRAYLKKAAVASFDGICSGDITVFRAKKNLLPELLPFVVNNEKFFDYAIKHSAGGLSPRVKFKDLANYEFLLPPKDQQAQLAELLWAMDEVVERENHLLRNLKQFFDSKLNKLMLEGIDNQSTKYCKAIKQEINSTWKSITIGELINNGIILKNQDGNHGESHPKSSDYVDDGIPFIMANSLVNNKIDLDSSKKLLKGHADSLRIGFSKPGDVLLSHKGSVGLTAIVPNDIEWPYLMLTPQVTYYRINPEKLSNQFLHYLFRSNYFQTQIQVHSAQSTRAFISISSQRKLKIVIPNNMLEQLKIVKQLWQIELRIGQLEDKIPIVSSLQKSLINQIF